MFSKNKKKVTDYTKYYPLFFTFVFVYILIQYPFNSLEAFFYDLRIRLDLEKKDLENIVIITLDEESDEFLGEKYPYTYSTHSRFFSKLMKDRPKIVNYLLSLEEAHSEREKDEIMQFEMLINDFQTKGGHFRFGTEMDQLGEHLPPDNLRKIGFSLALLHVDSSNFSKDDVCRRAIINISGDESIHLWTSNLFRKYKGLGSFDPKQLVGSYYSSEADATFSLFRYTNSPLEKDGKITKIPFHRVVVGNFPKGFFQDKIVLVGPQYISRSEDFILTPFNKEDKTLTPKINVHAIIINSLYHAKTILQIPKNFTFFFSMILSIVLPLVVINSRPTKGLIFIICTILGIFLISFSLFYIVGLWIYMTHLILTVFLVYYILVPFRAITEYQTRYAIEEEAKLFKKVDHLKQNFISLMSHDLKTPVARISGIAEILKNKNVNEEKERRYIESIISATQELNHFITSILDLVKIESRKISLNISSKDLNSIIEVVVVSLQDLAKINDIIIDVDLAPLFPIKIDADLIKRVISNILENAIKYAGQGRKVKIKTWEEPDWIYLEISDNGIGLTSESLDHIFEKFYRVKNDASHVVKGTGLGLYLVKYFIELHGGNISVSSQLHEGTKFVVRLRNA